MKPRLHRLLGNVQAQGRFGAAHLLDRTQDEHGPELVGEGVDRAFQDRAQLPIIHFLFWIAG